MTPGIPFSDEWQSRRKVKALLSATRWNRYVSNWSVTLSALRRLWETGKVSELKIGDFTELLRSDNPVYPNKIMVTKFPFHDEWISRNMARRLVNATHWNQYVSHWSVALAAMRRLWEMGKVSELKSPFYEPFEKPVKNNL